MAEIIAARIAQLRGLVGLSKTELAARLDVTPSAVSQWESSTKQPALEKILALAQALQVSPSLLQRPMPQWAGVMSGPITFRARSSARTRVVRSRANSLAWLMAEVFDELTKSIKLPEVALPEISDSDSVENVDALAEAARTAFGLGLRPIMRLGELLESKGIILSEVQFGDARLDAFSCIVNGRAFIFFGTDKGDRARRRFDAAHELGHLLIHQHLSQEEFEDTDTLRRIEREADAFASAFLLPKSTFTEDVQRMSEKSLSSFLRLKARWGVSAQAMMYRARDLKLIGEETYTQLCKAAAMRRWRGAKQEPGDDLVPEIKPTLGPRAVQMLADAGIVQQWQLLEQLPMPTVVWRSVANIDPVQSFPAELETIVPFPAQGALDLMVKNDLTDHS